MERKKIHALSIMTAFLCCFVVMIHLTSYPVGGLTVGSWQHELFFIGNKALSFVVPSFVFLSGLKLTYTYKDKEFRFFSFLRTRLTKILFPYLIWYVLYYLLFRYLGFVSPKNLQQHMFSFVIGDLVSPFYFITIIFQFYLLFGIFLKLFWKVNHIVLLAATFVIEIFYLHYTFLPYEDRFFLTYLIYFVFGCYVAFHLEKIKQCLQKWRGVILSVFICFMVWHIRHAYLAVLGIPYVGWRLIGCFFSLLAIMVLLHYSMTMEARCGSGIQKGFQSIDRSSYQIFLAHCFVLYLCNGFWARMGIASLIGKFLLNTMAVYPIVFAGAIGFGIFKKNLREKR